MGFMDYIFKALGFEAGEKKVKNVIMNEDRRPSNGTQRFNCNL